MTVRKKSFGSMMAASGAKMSAVNELFNNLISSECNEGQSQYVSLVWRSFEILFGTDLG